MAEQEYYSKSAVEPMQWFKSLPIGEVQLGAKECLEATSYMFPPDEYTQQVTEPILILNDTPPFEPPILFNQI